MMTVMNIEIHNQQLLLTEIVDNKLSSRNVSMFNTQVSYSSDNYVDRLIYLRYSSIIQMIRVKQHANKHNN